MGLLNNKKESKTGKVYNLIILDESGSMDSIYEQAFTGANETINTIRAARKDNPDLEQYLTFVTFDSGSRRPDVREIIALKPIEEVGNLDRNEYRPTGCTPLYDAMGISISRLSKQVKDEDNVLVTIITDGYENSSREYSASSVKALVELLRKKNWVFTYIGANQDSVEEAKRYGIDNAMDFSQDAVGSTMMFEKMHSSHKRYYARVMYQMDRKCKEDLSDDFFSQNESASRVTPTSVSNLNTDQILVVGADANQPAGIQDQHYAIPTVGKSLEEIKVAVREFILYAEAHPEQTFLVTRIGCGHAGYTDKEIAPMFAPAVGISNIHLPDEFWNVINYRFKK